MHQRGNTREEAIKNIREAIKLYLEPVDDDNNRRKHTSNEILMHTKSMTWTHGHFLNFANLSFEPLTAVSSEYSLFPYSVGKAIVGNFLCNGSILSHVELV